MTRLLALAPAPRHDRCRCPARPRSRRRHARASRRPAHPALGHRRPPEGDQICQRDGTAWRCGDDAAAALRALVDGRELACIEIDRDRYGRAVATCTVAGQDVGGAMVRQGWALDFERYSGGAYAAEQLEAEHAQRGLWSGAFVPP